VYAAVGGTVSWMATGSGPAGHGLRIRGTDGRLYAYYHLGPYGGTRAQAYAPGVAVGTRVARGQLIGYLGDSGNAVGGAPHLHFEIHQDGLADPHGSSRLNPYLSLVAAQRRGDFGSGAGRQAAPSASGPLRLGARGAAVAEWQRELSRALGQPLAADGVFGPATDLATRELQRRHGLVVDGIVGPRTRAAAAAG
jgi:murein DD-endopeptidase MepM/ murein hydrolase activator NlpD